MDKNREKKISKWLSYLLRHHPEKIGLQLDAQGWVEVDYLLRCSAAHQFPLTREELAAVIANNDKQRFAWSEDRQRIRAVHGHSIAVELKYQPLPPPMELYHGTAKRFLPSIRQYGLRKQRRNFVHLSANKQEAREVGQRHGSPALLIIAAKQMADEGYCFYKSDSGIWLTEHVPVKFIRFSKE